MKKQVALSMKNHYLNYYRHFDNYRVEELDLKAKGSDTNEHINFLFFRNNSTLVVTGDFGDAVFKWYSNRNMLEDIAKYVKRDPYYFASKCTASSQPMYIYDSEKAKKDILDWLDDCCITDNDFENIEDDKDLYEWDSAKEFANDLADCFDVYRGFTFDNIVNNVFTSINEDALVSIDDDWGDAMYSIGRILNPRVEVYAHALNLGIKWKKREEIKNES